MGILPSGSTIRSRRYAVIKLIAGKNTGQHPTKGEDAAVAALQRTGQDAAPGNLFVRSERPPTTFIQ
jgi:hypothetical protein